LIIGFTRSAGQWLLVGDDPPLAGHQPQPHVAGLPGQGSARLRQCTYVVVEHRTSRHLEQPLLREAEPVNRLQFVGYRTKLFP
jgi:hypothetical protein